MNPPNEPSDDELRGLLRGLGEDSERRAPGFQGTWYAAKNRTGRERPGRWPVWVAAAAAIAVVLVAVMLWRPAAAPVIEPQAATANDEALPTDFLLVTNHNDDPVERLTGEIDALLQP